MPSDARAGGRCTAIVSWRVKAGKKDVFSSEKRGACDEFVRRNGGKVGGVKLRLVPPNRAGRR